MLLVDSPPGAPKVVQQLAEGDPAGAAVIQAARRVGLLRTPATRHQ